jgi:hypothetical protein
MRLKLPTRPLLAKAYLAAVSARADAARAGVLFGIAPGGACRATPVASGAVGSYPTVSSLPRRSTAVSFLWRFPSGFPARALPGTIALWSPDIPRRGCPPRGHPALCARPLLGPGKRPVKRPIVCLGTVKPTPTPERPAQRQCCKLARKGLCWGFTDRSGMPVRRVGPVPAWFADGGNYDGHAESHFDP